MATLADVAKLAERVDTIVARHEAATVAIDLGSYRGRIEAFAGKVLHVGILTDTQRAHLRAAVAFSRTAAYGANGCGKTFDDAIIALYLIYVENYLVIATSAKEMQVRDQYMRDIRRLFSQAPGLPGTLYTMQLRRSDDPESGLLCMAAGSADNLRSFHAPRVCVQLQEAQGLPDFAFESAEMMAVGDVDKVTLTGNSTMTGGAFHRRCLSAQWTSTRFNSEDHPNVVEGRIVIAGGPTRESRAQRIADYGIDSPFFVASWLGLFPSESIDGLSTRALVEDAFTRHETPHSESVVAMSSPVALGWDVSLRGADQNAVAIVQAGCVREFHTWHADDINVSYRRVEDLAAAAGAFWCSPELRELRARGGRDVRPRLVIDGSGLGGPACDAMAARGYPVTDFIGAATPTATTSAARFLNLRAEAMFVLRQALEQGTVALPRNVQLAEEILATRWSVNASDKIQIESKDDVRRQLGRSPDLLDATSMALWWTLTQKAGGQWGTSHHRM